jgi:uncharacterized spore protein YtfJ
MMVKDMTGQEMLKETALELERILASKNVMGAAVDIADKSVIPVARFGFGFGAGGGQGKMGGGEGGGAGGAIEPVALVIVHKDVSGRDGIQVLSLKRNAIAQVIEALSESLAPQVIEAIKAMSVDEKEEKAE